MEFNDLIKRYKNVPQELKILKRWVCFKVEGTNDGKTTKRPYNALNGKLAKVNDELTWCTFNIALMGCEKYNCDGIGFILGNGIFGIDLDNHVDENGVPPMTEEEFAILTKEFVDTLDSYSEVSQSGLGVHIICQGKLPKGSRRKGSVEMYDNGRFFAFTGNAINNVPIYNREQEIIPLWEKYVNTRKNDEQQKTKREINPEDVVLKLSDEEIIDLAINSKNGDVFYRYYNDGDISMNNNDQSAADMAFCNLLAFWCNFDQEQMDRIFRNSALMRDKWDEMRGAQTYGELTIRNACLNTTNGYVKIKKSNDPGFTIKNKTEFVMDEETGEILEDCYRAEMNIDENGEPIFRIKKNFKKYPYNDTGNALRFYDYFGEVFKYNVTDKCFMFWTGKTWRRDHCDIIRKYANKFIEILKEEEKQLEDEILKLKADGKDEEMKKLMKTLDACQKNTSRVSNKAGKDAMISEFKSLYDIPIQSSEFDKDIWLLNTDSGIVDLRNGKISPFEKDKLMSQNTNVRVTYNEPKEWIKFLRGIFKRDNKEETQQIIDSFQTCLGYSLTGSVREQVIFMLWGDGSNGKTTLLQQVSHIMGDYGQNIASDVLMQNKNNNNSATYSIAKLQNARYVLTEETNDGGRLAEGRVKEITGGGEVSAQFKYGNEFSYFPKYKVWVATNNLPIIIGTDHGIWRRIFEFPFLRIFTDEEKDKDLPEKLKNESSDILGWAIQGAIKYKATNKLVAPKCLIEAKQKYKEKMDVVIQFTNDECLFDPRGRIECKTLYTLYKEWAKNNSEYTLRESKFKERLEQKGVYITRNEKGKAMYNGIRTKEALFSVEKYGEDYD